ncbi:hypothetical protein FKP32DRAFT_1670967 [Trametes sanguinea]|nr:hypothetical protein FKP32DRAFT_1670967 [Trametes sanguinea]
MIFSAVAEHPIGVETTGSLSRSPGAATPSDGTRTSPAPRRFVEDAWKNAQTGWVCLGPAGCPVSAYDAKLFNILEQERPAEVGSWFSDAVRAGFFTTKLDVPSDVRDGALYVVYRGVDEGPGIYERWEDVVRLTLDIHGTLYQRCVGWMEAVTRFAQALAIRGLVCRLSDDVKQAGTMSCWLPALRPSPYPPLNVCPHLLPPPSSSFLGALPPCYRDATAGPRSKRSWHLFSPSQQGLLGDGVRESPPLPITPLSPSPRPLPRVSEHVDLPPAFLHPSQAPPLSAVGGVRRAVKAPLPCGRAAPSPLEDLHNEHVRDGEIFYVVYNGRVPWIYYTQ